ncbi:hypothetical protein QPK87_05455 [Kamptonema cortianum]|nr:hypothetical protein [Geitlerinema splendidum]MDK3156024.1 hypothetical protein [Kamptonema cortianum]
MPNLYLLPIAAIAVGGAGYFFTTPPTATQSEKESQVAERSPTYSGTIAKILNEKCVSCHRPDQAAPFSLIGYENAKRYSEMVAFATEKRRMPPWKAAPSDVEYADDGHLAASDIALLRAWADAGAPRGDQSKEPAPPKFESGWPLGKPDLVLEMPYAQTLSADGDDEYWNYVISPGNTEPIYVSALDVAPGNRRIVHHVIAFLDKSGRGKQLATGKDGDKKFGYKSRGGGVGFIPSGSLGGWAPGATNKFLPSNAGMLIEPGTDIILQVHYNKSGKEETDQTKIALYLNKEKPEREVQLAWMANPFIRIQPGKAGQTFKQEIPLPVSIRLYSVMPHMHLLGKAMKATAVLPDGKTIRLIEVNDWDFNWQLIYHLKQPLDLPARTKIVVEAEYDNSTDNPFQPNDPPKLVTWGEETTDEMMLLVAAYSVNR